MDQNPQFEMLGDIAVFRPRETVTLERAVELVNSAIASARTQRIRRLLVVTTGLEGFDPPGIGMRHFMARQWATTAGGAVRIAVVARPEMLDPHKFGVTVAANFGTRADVFVSESEALAWLDNTES